jgi:hypothetical protein
MLRAQGIPWCARKALAADKQSQKRINERSGRFDRCGVEYCRAGKEPGRWLWCAVTSGTRRASEHAISAAADAHFTAHAAGSQCRIVRQLAVLRDRRPPPPHEIGHRVCPGAAAARRTKSTKRRGSARLAARSCAICSRNCADDLRVPLLFRNAAPRSRGNQSDGTTRRSAARGDHFAEHAPTLDWRQHRRRRRRRQQRRERVSQRRAYSTSTTHSNNE